MYDVCVHIYIVCAPVGLHCSETLGLSMELNDDILVQTTSLQTIARVKRVKCFMLHKVASPSPLLRLFACGMYTISLA
jgi:hypothetical protein